MVIYRSKEYILTYASTFLDNLNIKKIAEALDVKKQWDYLIVRELPSDKDEINQEHFHVYLNWKRKGSPFIRNETYFDIPLNESVIVFWDSNIDTREYILSTDEETERGIELANKYENKKEIKVAHPNIQIKKGSIWSHTYYMIRYCLKQYLNDNDDLKLPITDERNIICNFQFLNELKVQYEKVKIKHEKKKNNNEFQTIEKDFCLWLRDLFLNNKSITKNEIFSKICSNEKYSYVYFSKVVNYKNLINDLFKEKPSVKPEPFWGIYYLPRELYNAMMYLNDWYNDWINGNIKPNCRPRPIFISGAGKTGKTSLVSCFGTFCYWCNTWNMNNYESLASFNFFDDYDGSEDFKNNSTKDNWYYLKPWIGGQQVLSISGKYKEPKTVINNRPTVFVSNTRFEDRFNEEARKYWKDCNGFIIDLNDDLINKKDTRTIGGFSKWVEYDTRNTYYYQSLEKQEEELKSEISEEYNSQPILIESEDEEVNEDGEDEIIVRPQAYSLGRQSSKRSNPFAIKDAEERVKKGKRID